MIDIENEIFSQIATSLREKYGAGNIYIIGEYVKTPTQYPAVTIMEIDNQIYGRTVDSKSIENYAEVTYEVNVYSNLTKGKKAQCKDIIHTIDDEFKGVGFRRRTLTSVENEDGNGVIYRMVGRYSAVVSENNTIYGR